MIDVKDAAHIAYEPLPSEGTARMAATILDAKSSLTESLDPDNLILRARTHAIHIR